MGIAGSPKHGTDPCHELARVEGLGEVIVRTEFKAEDTIDVVAFGCDHDNGDGHGPSLKPTADRQTILSRQHQVEQHKIDPPSCHDTIKLHRIVAERHIETLAHEELTDELADLDVVLDDDDEVSNRR